MLDNVVGLLYNIIAKIKKTKTERRKENVGKKNLKKLRKWELSD